MAVNNIQRLSRRVEDVTEAQLREVDLRICPVNNFTNLAGFSNYYPVRRTPGNPHPSDWVRVGSFAQWQTLEIGTVLFVKWTGAQTNDWRRGWYQVNKR